jgi:hypothetical protein
MAFRIPAIDGFDRIRIYFRGRHPLRFLIWNVFANGSINVNEVVLTALRQDRTHPVAIIVNGVNEFAHAAVSCDDRPSMRWLVNLNNSPISREFWSSSESRDFQKGL